MSQRARTTLTTLTCPRSESRNHDLAPEGPQHRGVDVLQSVKFLRILKMHHWLSRDLHPPVGEGNHHLCFPKGRVLVLSWKRILETTKRPPGLKPTGFHFQKGQKDLGLNNKKKRGTQNALLEV